jgi:hypothetical protein
VLALSVGAVWCGTLLRTGGKSSVALGEAKSENGAAAAAGDCGQAAEITLALAVGTVEETRESLYAFSTEHAGTV